MTQSFTVKTRIPSFPPGPILPQPAAEMNRTIIAPLVRESGAPGEAFGQMLGRDRRFTERDARRIHFGVVADLHDSKVIGTDCYHKRRAHG